MVIEKAAILPDGWKTTIISSLDQVEIVRPIWKKMQAEEPYPVINADIDRYLSVLQALEDKACPLIVLLERNDQPRAMIIGRREKHIVPIRVGYKILFKPKLDCLAVVYGGILGQPDEQINSVLVVELMRLLKRRTVDAVYFNHLCVDSIFYKQICKIPNFLVRNHFPLIQLHWRVNISKSKGVEEFYASLSQNHRKHIRKYFRILEETYKGNVDFRCYRKPDDVAQVCKDVAYISQRTYQHGLGVGFTEDSQNSNLLRAAAEKGWLRAYILYINENPVAFELALKYNNICFGETAGYDPKWGKYNVGTITQIKILESVCNEQDVDYYDFGLGHADYKQRLGNKSWQEAALTYLFACRPYPLVINTLNAMNSGFVLGLTWLLLKTKIFLLIKRIWRRNLQKING